MIRLRGIEDQIPNEMRTDFEELEKALTRGEAKGDEGRIAATMSTMESDEAARHAEKILHMFVPSQRWIQ